MNSNELEKNQDLVLKNRESLHINGINKVVSLNKDEFVLGTVYGMMSVKGNNLEMAALDTNNGTINIKGFIISIEYQHKQVKIKEKSFLSKVFK